jgi:hypothetical protein
VRHISHKEIKQPSASLDLHKIAKIFGFETELVYIRIPARYYLDKKHYLLEINYLLYY